MTLLERKLLDLLIALIAVACFVIIAGSPKHLYRVHDGAIIIQCSSGYTDTGLCRCCPKFSSGSGLEKLRYEVPCGTRSNKVPELIVLTGYSRGAYGAAWHAAPTFPDVKDPLVLMGGTRDERWLQSGVDYASYLGRLLP